MTLILMYVIKIIILSDFRKVLVGDYCLLKSYKQKTLKNMHISVTAF